MGGVVLPPCLLSRLRCPHTGAYRLLGGADGGFWEGSRQWVLPRIAVASVLVPTVSCSHPPDSAGDPPTLAGRSGPVSYGVTALFPWVLVRTRPCVCSPRVKFLFPSVLWNSCDQTLLAFKARFSGGSFSHCRNPKLGSLMWGSELSLLWENFCGIIISQFVGRPPSRYGIRFYCNCAPSIILLWLLLCLWM